jgi:hypothetical protein
VPFDRQYLGDLCWGPLTDTADEPLVLTVRFGDLRPRFLPKERVGQGYRALARNGRILLASDVPVTELPGRVAAVRLQTWHRTVLPGDASQVYGLLLCVRAAKAGATACLSAELIRLDSGRETGGDLLLYVGGLMALAFRPFRSATSTSTG